MGYNIAGMLIKGETDQTIIEDLLDAKISFPEEINFEDATTGDREENTIDILQTNFGTLIFTEFGSLYDISNFEGEIIQFIISDISDTYYFEKYIRGKLDRKYIYSQGEISEDEGSGIIKEGDDLEHAIWQQADDFLQNNFTENMFDLQFKRYHL
ncbi:hypothetical protein A0O34_17590 [Chryseobacterium glaciei]|uniref:Uncharacterized protein n=1 Tax=Chryseobacterium glaciei TaxID=1685010 RepID=A0A172XYZ6_9FLAO|nr:hypothetical protein [Chryseobacterium glaciei]ANF52218.1 hypothetical protein A0O34_17590 [Chryseobacterium glaciei]